MNKILKYSSLVILSVSVLFASSCSSTKSTATSAIAYSEATTRVSSDTESTTETTTEKTKETTTENTTEKIEETTAETTKNYDSVVKKLLAEAVDADYEELTRYPENYSEEAFKFTGEVILANESEDSFNLIVYQDGDMDKVWQVIYLRAGGGPRVIVGDNVVVYGLFQEALTSNNQDSTSINYLTMASLMIEINN